MPFDFIKNKEIGKLIEFAYHMNKEGIIDHFFFKSPVFYNGMNYGKETEFGGFLTRLGYP